MEDAVIVSLNSLEDSLNSLITSLTTTNTFTGATSATHDILAADDALTSALTLLKRHQDNYKTILKLEAEADSLREQLKDTIRTCNSLRTEIGHINPIILDGDDSDSEDDIPSDTREIDYDTLLAFAARIGKHNAAAAREAEQESNRRRAEASKNKTGQANGDTSTQDESTGQTATQESQAALSAINEALSFQRAAAGMAFPAPDHLRMGVLGQLQLLREQEGEDAVERQVQRLVRVSEQVLKEDEGQRHQQLGRVEAASEKLDRQPSIGQAEATRPAGIQSTAIVPPRKVKKVNLNFDEFGSDEED